MNLVKLQDTKLKPVVFLYTNKELSGREIKETIPYTIATLEKLLTYSSYRFV